MYSTFNAVGKYSIFKSSFSTGLIDCVMKRKEKKENFPH